MYRHRVPIYLLVSTSHLTSGPCSGAHTPIHICVCTVPIVRHVIPFPQKIYTVTYRVTFFTYGDTV